MRYLAIILPLLLTPTAAAQSGGDEGWLTRVLERALSDTGRVVDITGFRGALSSEATLERLTIGDDVGTWLTVENAVLSINRGAILGGRIEIGQLVAERVALDRLPSGSNDDAGMTPEAGDFALPELPLSINIDRIGAGRVALGEAILGEAVELNVEGDLELAGGAGRANLEITRLDGPEGRFALSASYGNQSRELILDLDVSEAAGGLAATLLGLPDEPSLALRIAGAGSPDDFMAEVNLASDGAARVAGTVTLGLDHDALRVVTLDLGGDLARMLAPNHRDFFGDDLLLDVRAIAHPDGRVEVERMSLRAARVVIDGTLSLAEDLLPEAFALDIDIFSENGKVRLPVPGAPLEVSSARLTAVFDEAEGDKWGLSGHMNGLVNGPIAVETMNIDAGGTIRRGDARRISAAVNLDAMGVDFGDAALERAFGRDIGLAGKVDWHGGGPLRLTEAKLEAGGLELIGSAAFGGFGGGLNTDIDLRLETRDLSRLEDLAGMPLAGGIGADLVGSVALLTGAFDLNLDATALDLSIRNPSIDPLLRGESKLRFNAARTTTGIELRDFFIETTALSARLRGGIATDLSDLTFNLALDDLGRFVPPLPGPVIIDGVAGERADGWVVMANLAAPDGMRGTSKITIPSDGGPILLDDLSVTARGAALEGRARLNRGEGDRSALVEARVNVPRLSNFADIGGFDIAGALETDVVFRTNSKGLSPVVALNGSATDLSFGIDILDGLLAGRRNIALEAVVADEGGVELRGFTLSGDGLEVTVEGGLAENDAVFDLSMEIDDMERTGGPLEGPIRISANMRREAEGWRARARADAVGSVTLAIEASAPPDLTTVDISSFKMSAPGAEATGGAELRLAGAEAGMTLRAEMEARDLGGLSDVLGRRMSGSFSARLSVDASLDGGRFSASAEGGGESIGLGMSAVDELLSGTSHFTIAVEKDSDSLRIERADLRSAALEATATGRFAGEETSFDFRTRLDRLSRFVPNVPGPVTVTGTARGREEGWVMNAAVDGPDNSTLTVTAAIPPDGEISIDIGGNLNFIARLDPELPGTATLDLSIERAGKFLRVDGNAEAPDGTRVRLAGNVAPDLTEADLSAGGIAPLGLINGWISPRVVRGKGNFDMRLNGPIALSSVTGTIVTEEARLALPVLGHAVTGIEGQLQLSESRAFIELVGTAAAGGRLGLSGSLDLDSELSTDLVLSLTDLRLRKPGIYDTVGSGDLSVTGPLKGDGIVSGEIILGRFDMPLARRGAAAVIIPDVIHIEPSLDVLATRIRARLWDESSDPRHQKGYKGLRLNIRVVAVDRIFVKGRGLDAELGGNLLLSGKAYEIIPTGNFELIRGHFDILSQRLVLNEGSARMAGEFIPFIRFVADTTVDGTAIRAVVDGPATNPDITFTSNPELPEEEVLARLLFGRSLSNLSPIQAARLANAITVLSGRGDGGLLNPVRETAGVDDFDLVGDDQGSVSLRVGKYLDEYFYTDVTLGRDQRTEINLNLDVTPGLTARTGIETQSGGTSFGLFFERDY